ncbi:EF-hand domain-containing protein [Sphingomonas naphthae]|uniref:EF-hand domain-containing protein n=1 Tax=Sphingomonas naphthae TaxID=1813468 RepID=A0ABY7TN78_9SPHN|nr:EF-hand domain-containing protein [Sphingomonas naphthae]WCT74385.1 EF-hand domain-containing protein [Sphingomonas naphthae]
MTPILLLLALAAPAAKPVKLPKDAPFCAAPDAPQTFVSPLGEPFRAKGGEPYPSATWFARADTNADGRLSSAEFVADAAGWFRKLDKDNDAALIPDEIAAYERDTPEIALYRVRERGPRQEKDAAREERRQERRSSGGPPRDTTYGGAMGAGRYGWLNIPHPLWGADTDLDRAVTAAEFAAAARKRFVLLDKGGRGFLTLADLGPTAEQADRAAPCRPRPSITVTPGEPGAKDAPRR